MITIEKAKRILREEYTINNGNIKTNPDDFIYSFRVWHKMLCGHKNVNRLGKENLGNKYVQLRDNSNGKIKSIAEIVEITLG